MSDQNNSEISLRQELDVLRQRYAELEASQADLSRAREALRASEHRFKETADMLPGIICEIDLNRRFTYVNEIGFRSFGYGPEIIEQGICIDDIVHPDDLNRMLRNAATILTGKLIGPQEYRMVHKDGAVCHYLLSSAPMVRDGVVCGMRTSVLDLTEKRRSEQQVRESEARFRSIYAHSPIGIGLFDVHGKCVDVNKSFRAMFCIGDTNDCHLDLLKVVPIAQARWNQVLSGEGLHQEGLFDWSVLKQCVKLTQENMAPRYLEWHVTSLAASGESQAPVVLVQVQDTTERKQAEEAKLAEARATAERIVAEMRKDMVQTFSFHNMVSRSPDMRRIFDVLPQMAETSTTVLVTGESGTGKELIARSLHELSPRSAGPFVAVNCSALPDNLLESELFGYKAGAFTDAKKDKPGRFAQANGGTLFLDEIGELSPMLQAKLLRVLQERTYEPLGATASVRADARIITATNRNLTAMAREGKFREDLFYRIKVLHVHLPPLRERRSDIPLLCERFIETYNRRYSRSVKTFSAEAMDLLLAHPFPGNIRELENVVEHVFVFCKGEVAGPEHLPPELRAGNEPGARQALAGVKNLDDIERVYLQTVIADAGGNKTRAAERLGIHKATLFRKLKRLGIGTEG